MTADREWRTEHEAKQRVALFQFHNRTVWGLLVNRKSED